MSRTPDIIWNRSGETVAALVGLGLAGASVAAWVAWTTTSLAGEAPAPGGAAALTLGLVALAGLGALAAVGVRRMRRERAVEAVRSALHAIADGEVAGNVLRISPRMGTEATVWNSVVDAWAEWHAGTADDTSVGTAGPGTVAPGDQQSVLDAMSDGVLLLNRQGIAVGANGAAAIILGIDRAQLAGAAMTTLIPEEDPAAMVQEVLAGGTRPRGTAELRRTRGDQAVVIRLQVRSIPRSEAVAALVIVQDITQQRLAEESRNLFVAHVTHELRTPLTNIRLYAESAIENGQDDPSMLATCLNVINQESRRLERIVGDMLCVSEIDAGSFELRSDDVRLDALLAELETDYRQSASEKEVELVFDSPPKLPVLHGDRDKIALALHNLIGNAIKYTPSGGRVTVTTVADGHGVVFEVADTGIGIDDAEQQSVFDRFYRARDPRVDECTGSGLGLTLSREIARLHGGDIDLRSERDQGSTFSLSLPCREEAA